MTITAKQIQELRNKYNVGSFEQVESNPQDIANQRINSLKAGSYAPTTPEVTRFSASSPSVTPQKQEKGFLEKASDLAENTLGKASDFLFGSTGKAVGGLATSAIGSATALAGKEKLGSRLEEIGAEAITPGNVAFAALELYPGGGFLSKALKKIPGGAKLISKLDDVLKILPKSQQSKAVKLYTEALAPTTKETKAIAKKVIPGLIEKGEKAGVLSGISKIGAKAKSEIVKFGSKIDDVIELLPKDKRVKLQPVLKAIDDWGKRYIVDDVVVNEKAVGLADNLADMFKKFGGDLDVGNVRRVRQVLDEAISQGKGFTADTITKLDVSLKKKAADALRGELAQEVPELAKLNKQFSFWRGVDDVVSETLKRKASQTSLIRKGVGASIGAKIGSFFGMGGTATGAVVGSKVSEALGSAAWKTRNAVWRNNFAKAVVAGQTEKVLLMMKTLGVVTKNEIDELLKK